MQSKNSEVEVILRSLVDLFLQAWKSYLHVLFCDEPVASVWWVYLPSFLDSSDFGFQNMPVVFNVFFYWQDHEYGKRTFKNLNRKILWLVGLGVGEEL